MEIKYEIWKNGKKYVVAREKGRLIQRRPIKGSGFKNKREALAIYKENKTFYKNKIKYKLTNVTETQILKPVSLKNNSTPWKNKAIRKPRGHPQYVVQGMFKGKLISGRSHKYKTVNGFAQTSKQAKDDAWENFLSLLSIAENGGEYDADEGIRYIENNRVTNISEGWVYYS